MWKITTGKLPQKLRLYSSTGAITGEPVEAGSSTITVELSHTTAGPPVTKDLTITIQDGLAISTPSLLGEARTTVAFAKAITAAGGNALLTWSLPTNPAGWAIDGSGNLTGTPAAKGKLSIQVKVVDADAKQATKTFTLDAVERQMAKPPCPNGESGAAHPEQTMSPSGGTAPYSNFRVDAGSLPPGMNIDPSTGKISGTPTATGAYQAKIEATNPSTKPLDAAVNPKAKDYVIRALQIGAATNINAAARIDGNGVNVLDTFGFRKLDEAANVQSWFPNDGDSKLAPHSVSGYNKETRDNPQDGERAGIPLRHRQMLGSRNRLPGPPGQGWNYFRHSKIAGDDAKVRAALTFHDLPNKDELEKLHKRRRTSSVRRPDVGASGAEPVSPHTVNSERLPAPPRIQIGLGSVPVGTMRFWKWRTPEVHWQPLPMHPRSPTPSTRMR